MYEVLISHLRECAKLDPSDNNTFKEAADAIEKLQQTVDAIPHVCECCIGCEVESGGGCDRAFVLSPKRAMEYLSKLRWIPMTDRLPEEKTYVLILADTIAGKMEKVSFLYKDSDGRNCWSTLDVYGKNLFDWQPTHWMPLPEPPKEE